MSVKQSTPDSLEEISANSTSEDSPSESVKLPVLPLRETVVFPGVTLPILAGRTFSLKAIDAATASEGKLIFAVLQDGTDTEATTENLNYTGTIARIDQKQTGLAGTQLLLTGLRRGVAVRYQETDGYFSARVNELEDKPPANDQDTAFVALHRELRERAAEFAQRSGLPTEAVESVLRNVTEPGPFTDLVAGYVDLGSEARQKILETQWIEERLRMVLTHVQRQLNLLDAQADIKTRVQEEIGDRQREMFLREQLKAIQAELGEGEVGSDELAELRKRLEDIDLPEQARKEVDREFGRLDRMGREAMEAQVIRNYLETLAELPWNERSDERLDISDAAEVLATDHYGLEDVKDRVLEFLAVRKLQSERRQTDPSAETADEPSSPKAGGKDRGEPHEGKAPILLFTGPPGVGKTSIAQSIARAMGREYHRISLGGARDEADIRGHRRTYVAAMPGRIIQGLKQAGTRNPVILLDEIDKLGVSYQGNPASALLEVLDPAQNSTFTDHYLGVPFDLSEVLFIATANLVEHIPAPLLDRMEQVEFSGYTEREKLEIAKRYLLPRQRLETGIREDEVEVTDEAIQELVSGYTREAGVRQLERELGRLLRKIARKIAAAEVDHQRVDRQAVTALLGRPRVHPETAAPVAQQGVATGMFYTPAGGDILFVEVSHMPGKGELVLTGQLGDVMRESARAAWTYARANADALGIPKESFQEDLHVHVPAGAIPKDGPSAGVTIASALVSALSGRRVRNDIAMTGEITLTGRILPIGGVKEKLLGAERAGIRSILLPKDNAADLDDLPTEVRDRLEIHLVSELGEALALTLEDAIWRDGQLLFGKAPQALATRPTIDDLH